MDTLNISLAIVGGLTVYITICGFAFAIVPKKWDDEKFTVACVWPLAIAVFVIIKLLLIGPRIAKWHEQRTSIPRAISRFEKEKS